jgi:hypothetical protein
MYRVLIYRDTTNLGDAIQTVALCRLLGGQCWGLYRDEPFPEAHKELTLVLNGWLGYAPPSERMACIFAGVHLARNEDAYVAWMRQSNTMIGARDPYTMGLLRANRLAAKLVGCATLTFEPYRGHRVGRYSVDVEPVDGTSFLTNAIGALSWSEQWALALERLNQLRRAEVIYTNRLHVVLPCLAFGTPVVFPLRELDRVGGKQRLTLLDELPFAYDEEVRADVSSAAKSYIAYLQDANVDVRITSNPPMPIPLCP